MKLKYNISSRYFHMWIECLFFMMKVGTNIGISTQSILQFFNLKYDLNVLIIFFFFFFILIYTLHAFFS
jgi:hypothetical protein